MNIRLLTLLLLGGCANQKPLELVFPSVGAFANTSSARVFVVGPVTDLGACAELAATSDPSSLVNVVESTAAVPVCDAAAGALTIAAAPQGTHAYVAMVFDDASRVLLSGCVIADAHAEDDVRITLVPTAAYRTAYGATPETCTFEQRCGGGCP